VFSILPAGRLGTLPFEITDRGRDRILFVPRRLIYGPLA
jgi:hypothetical protein